MLQSLYNKSLTYYNLQIYGTVHYSVLYMYKKGVLPAAPHIQTCSLYTVHEYNSCMKQAYFVFIIKQNVSGNSRVRKMQSSFAGRLRRCSHLCLIS